MTPSTQLEIHTTQRRQGRTEPRPKATHTENLTKFEHLISRYVSGHTYTGMTCYVTVIVQEALLPQTDRATCYVSQNLVH